jgi:hypothetical protein
MQAKLNQVAKYWKGSTSIQINYANFDPLAVKKFEQTHPALVAPWIAHDAETSLVFNSEYQLTPKEKNTGYPRKRKTSPGCTSARSTSSWWLESVTIDFLIGIRCCLPRMLPGKHESCPAQGTGKRSVFHRQHQHVP